MSSVVFFGSPQAAVPALQALARRVEVAAVVTQPNRPRGRSGTPRPSPVREAAELLGLPVMTPTRMSEAESVAAGCDLGVLVAFGRIIKPRLLEAPRLGIVNVHFSLLPRWRGAAPVQRTILSGDDRTGVTLMQMDEGLDTGPILASAATPVGADEDAGELTERLAALGADLLAAELAAVLAGELTPREQIEADVTLAPRFGPDDARIDVTASAEAVVRLVRAFSPRPGAWGELDGERFKVLAAVPSPHRVEPGVIVDAGGTPVLGTATTAIELVRVQAAGRGVVDGRDWHNGRGRRPARLR